MPMCCRGRLIEQARLANDAHIVCATMVALRYADNAVIEITCDLVFGGCLRRALLVVGGGNEWYFGKGKNCCVHNDFDLVEEDRFFLAR